MPSKEQHAQTMGDQISRLLNAEFERENGDVVVLYDVAHDMEGDPIHMLWFELRDSEKRSVLANNIEWGNLSPEQIATISTNVIEQERDPWVKSEIRSRWFEGAIPENPAEKSQALERVATELDSLKQRNYGTGAWNGQRWDKDMPRQWEHIGGTRQLDLMVHEINWEGTSHAEQWRIIAREANMNSMREIEQDVILERLSITPEIVTVEDGGLFERQIDPIKLAERIGQWPSWAGDQLAREAEQYRPEAYWQPTKDRSHDLER